MPPALFATHPSCVLEELQVWDPTSNKTTSPVSNLPCSAAGGVPLSPSHARSVPSGDSARVGVRLTPDGDAECRGHEPAENIHPGRPGSPGTGFSTLSWSQRRRNPAEPMQKSGPSPEEGRNRHHVVPGGGRAPRDARQGERVSAGPSCREMEQRRVLRGLGGAG